MDSSNFSSAMAMNEASWGQAGGFLRDDSSQSLTMAYCVVHTSGGGALPRKDCRVCFGCTCECMYVCICIMYVLCMCYVCIMYYVLCVMYVFIYVYICIMYECMYVNVCMYGRMCVSKQALDNECRLHGEQETLLIPVHLEVR